MTAVAGVRPLTVADGARLAEIHIAAFGHLGATEDAIDRGYRDMLPRLLLDNPDADRAAPSLVFEHDGVIVGFVLVACHPVVFRGERRWLATTSHLGVLPEARASLAGIHLLRATVAGPQDLTYADRSNTAGRQALRAAGFEQVPASSLRWTKTLRPGVSLSQRIATRLPAGSDLLVRTARRAERSLPAPVRARAVADLPPVPTTLGSEPLRVDHVTAAAPDLLAGADLHPVLTDAAHVERAWALIRAARVNSTIVASAVLSRGGGGDVVGWYIVDIAEGGVADVVQFIALPAFRAGALLLLLHDLRGRGVVSASGDLPLSMLYDADGLGCRTTAADAATSVHTDDPGIAAAFRHDRVWLSAIEGEYLMDPPAAVPG